MGHAQHLREIDARAVIRLVHEVCELGADPDRWREHALEQLIGLTDAAAGMAYVGPLSFDPARTQMVRVCQVGTDPRVQRYGMEADLADDPMTPEIVARLGKTYTTTRRQLASDRAWYSSAHFNELLRPCGYNDNLISFVSLPHRGLFSGIGFLGHLDGKPFLTRHRQLLELFHTEVGRLWDRQKASAIDELPRRLSEVLALLREGFSEKQIAWRLGLSRHTVHDYVKELHRRLEISSRAELLAQARPDPWVPRLT